MNLLPGIHWGSTSSLPRADIAFGARFVSRQRNFLPTRGARLLCVRVAPLSGWGPPKICADRNVGFAALAARVVLLAALADSSVFQLSVGRSGPWEVMSSEPLWECLLCLWGCGILPRNMCCLYLLTPDKVFERYSYNS